MESSTRSSVQQTTRNELAVNLKAAKSLGIGVLLTLGKTHVASSEVYAGGRIDPLLSLWFAERLKETGLAG